MGNEQSQLAEGTSFGFQVLRNNSATIFLEPWFDFICGINGRQIEDGDAHLFQQEILNCAGTSVIFAIWSAKGQTIRDLRVAVPSDATRLNVSLQWAPLLVTEDVWHILDIAPDSPADLAGLISYSDYIIGTRVGVVRGESGLGALVEDHLDRPLPLYVYNHDLNITREITIVPTRGWGGEGALGCVLGYGALHRLPMPLTEPLHSPGEALFDMEDQLPLVPGDHFVAADPMEAAYPPAPFFIPRNELTSTEPFVTVSPRPEPGLRKSQTKHKARPHLNPLKSTDIMDLYMQEEESKNQGDAYVNEKTALQPPPPPKAPQRGPIPPS